VYGKMKIVNFLDKMITLVFKIVKSASGRAPYIVLTGRRCGITNLNAHAHSENKSDDSEDRFYEELLVQVPYKVLLLNLNVRLGRGVIFEPTIENKNSHQKSNDSAANVIKR
jgi:hypothetical protein